MSLSYPPTENELAAYARRWVEKNQPDIPREITDEFVREYSEVFAGSIPPDPGAFWREYVLS